MSTWLRRVSSATLVSLAVLAASLTIGTTPPAAADVTPQAYECKDGHVCLYLDTNGRNRLYEIPASSFFDCTWVIVRDHEISSINNRTKYAIELWDYVGSPDGRYLVGTAAPFSAYGYFGIRGNDVLDTMASPPCI